MRGPAFAALLTAESQRREITWLSNEAPGVVAGAPSTTELRFLLGRTRFTNGQRRDEILAHSHPHGADVTWL